MRPPQRKSCGGRPQTYEIISIRTKAHPAQIGSEEKGAGSSSIFVAFDVGARIPKPLQIIEETRFFVEDVDDDVAVIENAPPAFAEALLTDGIEPVELLDLLIDVVAQRVDLRRRFARRDDEIAAHHRLIAHVEDDDVGRLLSDSTLAHAFASS